MNILIGITGGISAYKGADLIGGLKNYYKDIKVIMTERSKDFITPLTIATLSKSPVYDDTTEWAPHGRVDHVELANWADVFVVAPATANTIAKLVIGMADNLLTSTYLAFEWSGKKNRYFVVCPAMNTKMYNSSVTQKNILELSERVNHIVIPPVEGLLACGDFGMGKLAPTKTIIEEIRRNLA